MSAPEKGEPEQRLEAARVPALKQRATASLALAPNKNESGDQHDPKGNSLWLLPSGPDQIGETSARTDLRGRYDDSGSRMQAGAC